MTRNPFQKAASFPYWSNLLTPHGSSDTILISSSRVVQMRFVSWWHQIPNAAAPLQTEACRQHHIFFFPPHLAPNRFWYSLENILFAKTASNGPALDYLSDPSTPHGFQKAPWRSKTEPTAAPKTERPQPRSSWNRHCDLILWFYCLLLSSLLCQCDLSRIATIDVQNLNPFFF